MDYERICRMKDRDGGPLLIMAGVSRHADAAARHAPGRARTS